MKNKNKFSSYAEALKRLELLKSQELNEDVTKYVLKQNKPKEEAPVAEPSLDMTPSIEPAPADEPAPDAEPSAELPDMSAEPSLGDQSSEAGKRSDYMAEVQKFAGKLGQELRDQQDRMESDDIKYVLNMVISAVDLDKLDDEDIEDIGKKFDRDDESYNQEPEAEEPESDEVAPEEEAPSAPEDDLAERIAKLEELVNTSFDTQEQDLSEYDDEVNEFYLYDDEDFERTDKGLEPLSRRADGTKIRPEDSEEIELDITPELDDINESINTTLSKYFE
jgi:hypothetical protein